MCSRRQNKKTQRDQRDFFFDSSYCCIALTNCFDALFLFQVIPLAKKLKECQVFGVSSDEYLNYALQNLKEWERKGRSLCEVMKKKADKEARELGLIDAPEDSFEAPEVDHLDNDSVELSLGDTTIDTSQGTSLGSSSDFENIPKEVRSNIEERIAAEVKMALEDSALPEPRGGSDDADSRAHSIRSVKVPPGKLGVVIDASAEGPIVRDVYHSSPVKGRINPGDRIVEINGTSVDGLSQHDLAILMASSTDKEREFTLEST